MKGESMSTAEKTGLDHAEQNAKGHLDTMVEAFKGMKLLESGESESVTVDGDTFEDADDLREYIEQQALSVEVRNDWHSIGGDADPAEFRILLTTGGPALQVYGKLGMHGVVEDVSLQLQDWFTPWTNHELEWFASLFYFGDF
jgi:hypothetical protein